MLESDSKTVETLQFLCGLSPRMKECCWHNTNLATLFRYGRNVMKNSLLHPGNEVVLVARPRPEPGLAESGGGGEQKTQKQEEQSMTLVTRRVVVVRLPEQAGRSDGRAFLSEFYRNLDADRPRVVLDCSDVPHLNKTAIHILFSCLEEAMKRNGDVKLAALPSGAESAVEASGVSRVFEIYATPADAVNSFYQYQGASQEVMAVPDGLESESAA
jgi:anti-anti-sigma regulatory factor